MTTQESSLPESNESKHFLKARCFFPCIFQESHHVYLADRQGQKWIVHNAKHNVKELGITKGEVQRGVPHGKTKKQGSYMEIKAQF